MMSYHTFSGDRPLRVLQVSTWDINGGAEKIACDLYAGLRDRGYGSWVAVAARRSDDPNILEIPNVPVPPPWWSGIVRALKMPLAPFAQRSEIARRGSAYLDIIAMGATEIKRKLGHEIFDYPGSHAILDLPPERPDILHLHNIHGYFFDLRMLTELSHIMPVVFTMHDAWALTGHCGFSFDCDRWKTGCGHCPDLTIYPEVPRDATARNWKVKREIYRNSRIHVATPSQWLMNRVHQSMLDPVETRVIPSGVDLSIFRPADKATVRQELGLPADAWVLSCIANGGRKNRFKDYGTIEEAMHYVTPPDDRPAYLLAVGGNSATSERLGRIEVREVPFERDPRKIAQFYQASDIYLHAAKTDNFPTVILEALACGTPCIGTAIDGIPEEIVHGETGFLVPPRTAPPMVTFIEQLLKNDDLRLRMAANAVEYARRHFDRERMVDDYLRWYQALLAVNTNGRSMHAGAPA